METIKTLICDVTNDKGVKFNVTLEENEGINIVFYDSRYTKGFTKFGQSVSGYDIYTFLEVQGTGINLCGHVQDWTVTANNVRKIQSLI
tara:strand:- start:1846 stop:2112 length:267 start_codon:yes stop_codon:yes gene_type:complete